MLELRGGHLKRGDAEGCPTHEIVRALDTMGLRGISLEAQAHRALLHEAESDAAR